MQKSVDGKLVNLTDAEASELSTLQAVWNVDSNNRNIKRQIIDLEITITSRRRDEAILGEDNGWLANVRQQINALRAQLT